MTGAKLVKNPSIHKTRPNSGTLFEKKVNKKEIFKKFRFLLGFAVSVDASVDVE
jgi:hypothetical protein